MDGYFEILYDDLARGLTFVIGGQDLTLPEHCPEAIIVHAFGKPVIAHDGGKRTTLRSDRTSRR